MSEEFISVGKNVPRIGALEKATGKVAFTAERKLPRMLYAKILRSPHAHAKIIDIDTSKAEALPGVNATLTYKDIPGRIGDLDVPKRMFGRHGGHYILEDKVRFVGDEVAAVAATSVEIAERALELIDVQYQVLPAVFDPEEAMKPGAPILYEEYAPNNIAQSMPCQDGYTGHIGGPVVGGHGDMEEGFKEADFIIEHSVNTQRSSNIPNEHRSCLCDWDGDKLTVWEASQGPFVLQRVLAWLLGDMPYQKVRVISPYVGGGFGNRHMCYRHSPITALLSKKAGRPVLLELTYSEELIGFARGRWPTIGSARFGVKEDGTLTAMSCKWIQDAGAYLEANPGSSTAGALIKSYVCPNKEWECITAYTNLPTTGSMRSVGGAQGCVLPETTMEKVAITLGMDPYDLRLKNAQGTSYEGLEKGAEIIGWKERWHRPGEGPTYEGSKKRGLGMACTQTWQMGGGYGSSVVTVTINLDGTVDLHHGTVDLGTSSITSIAQICAEELGVRFEDVAAYWGDTTYPFDEKITASRSLQSGGNAAVRAAAKAKQKLLQVAAPMLEVEPEDLEAKNSEIFVRENPERKVSFADVALKTKNEQIITVGHRIVEKVPIPFSLCGHFLEVEVDTETGGVELLRYVCAHDVGRAINPNIIYGQIQGGIVQGISFGTTEELIYDKASGVPLSESGIEFKLLTRLDFPDVEITLVEILDPNGPFGAKGCGEPPTVCPNSAINNAIYNAIGIQLGESPYTPDKILNALGKI